MGKSYLPSLCASSSGYVVSTPASGPYVGGSTLNCGAGTMYDLWSFYSGSSEYAYVSVDTVSAKTAFDPRLYVLDDTMCSVGLAFEEYADDDFECTYAPSLWACPAFKVSLDPKSTYYVMVISLGTCNGTVAEYDLTVETDGDPSLTLAADDENLYTTVVTSTASVSVAP
jgi:hypothetical protein